jgi:hypothetical protein
MTERMSMMEDTSKVVGVIGGGDGMTAKQVMKELGESKDSDFLIDDERTIEDVIRQVAEEEGMTYEETMALFKKGLKEANGLTTKVDYKKKAKSKAKRKQAKASRKKNRK